MPSHRLRQFKEAITERADSWPHQRPVTRRPSEAHERYSRASDLLMIDIKQSHPQLYGTIEMGPHAFGTRLMFRTCHIAAVLAQEQSLGVNELAAAVGGEATYEMLGSLMTMTSRAALEAEQRMALMPTYQPVDIDVLKKWHLSVDGVQFDGQDEVLQDVNDRLDPKNISGECPLLRPGIHRVLVPAVIRICERDQNLFQRSLSSLTTTQ